MLDSFDEFEEEQNPNPEYSKTVGMCFLGDNVKAASVLLTNKVDTRGKVEAELLKLKSCESNVSSPPRKHKKKTNESLKLI